VEIFMPNALKKLAMKLLTSFSFCWYLV